MSKVNVNDSEQIRRHYYTNKLFLKRRKYHKIDENHVTFIRCTYVFFIYCCNTYQFFSSFLNYINRHISLALRLFILHHTTHTLYCLLFSSLEDSLSNSVLFLCQKTSVLSRFNLAETKKKHEEVSPHVSVCPRPSLRRVFFGR